MKALCTLVAAALLCASRAQAAPKACQGYGSPSPLCSTCQHCAYCGRDKGRAGNTAVCVVCEKARLEEEARKRR